MSTDAASPASSLPEDVGLCHAVISQLHDTVESLQRKLELPEHYLAQLLRQRYGPRSERLDPAQLALFDLQTAQAEVSAQEPATVAPKTSVQTYQRRGGGRNEFPADLSRKRVEYELPREQMACPCCGQQRTRFGEESSEMAKWPRQ